MTGVFILEKKKSALSKLLEYSGERKYLTYLSLVLSGISGLVALVPFIYIWKVIKEVLEVMPKFSNATDIVKNGWLAVVFSLISMLVYFVALMCSHISAFKVAANMRIKSMKHITELPIGIISEFGSGKLRKIVTESSAGTETYLAHQLPDMAAAIMTPIGMIILLFVFDWKLGLISLLPTVLGFLCMMKMSGPAMAEDMKKYQDSLEDMNNEAVEYVRGIPVVKTFGQSVYTFKKFKKSIDNYKTFCIAYTKKCRNPMLLYETCINSVFVFLIGAALIITGGNNVQETFLLNLIFYIIFTPIIATTLTKIMFMSENKMAVEDSLERIDNILNLKPLEISSNYKKPQDNSVILKNVKFKYEESDKLAINNVSLTIGSNKSIALVGPSGGGKTTIANLISRFYDVNEGQIFIGGVNIKDIKKEDLMNTISYVFQDGKLLKKSVYENVKMGKENATREEVLNAIHLAQLDDVIKKLPNGVDTVVGSEGVYFSGGEVQRITIARAILKNAPILILDEATAFSDPENEVLVQKAFKELSKNKTVIMIAHRLTTIQNVDKIFVLRDGKIAEEGNHKELLKENGLYKNMWDNYQKTLSWKIGGEQ